MKNKELLLDLVSEILNDNALAEKLAQIDTNELRQQLLALAQLRLLKTMTEPDAESSHIRSLLQIIKPLAMLEIKEKDLAEKRMANERWQQIRQAARDEKKNATNPPKPAPSMEDEDEPTADPTNRASNSPNHPGRPTLPQTPPATRPCPTDPDQAGGSHPRG